MSPKIESEDVKSPCIRNCCLDDNDFCVGCFRHLDEIIGWSSSSSEKKKKILILCRERRAKNKNINDICNRYK